MDDILRLSEAIELFRARIEAPGFLAGRQRSPDFRAKLLRAGVWLIHVQRRMTETIASLGVGAHHRFPFARRAVAQFVGSSAYTCQRLIPLMVKAGLLSEASELQRWAEAGRVAPEGRRQVWYMPTTYNLGAAFERILSGNSGTIFADPPIAKQSAPDKTLYVSEQRSEGGRRESLAPPVRSASKSSINHGSAIDDVDDALEGSLDTLRRVAVPQAMPDDRRAPQVPEQELHLQILADMAARRVQLAKPSSLLMAALARQDHTRRW